MLAASQVIYDVMAIPDRMYSQREKVLSTLTKLLDVEREVLIRRFDSGKIRSVQIAVAQVKVPQGTKWVRIVFAGHISLYI